MNTVIDTDKGPLMPQPVRDRTIPESARDQRGNVTTAAVRRALDLLGRASEDWRGNGATDVGSLHWPVAVNLARRELVRALEALEHGRVIAITERRASQAGGPQP